MNLTCPHCGRVNEAHDGPTPDSTPKPGDVSVCWGCRQLGIYDDTPFGLTVRKPTQTEQVDLEADPNVRAVLGVVSESYTPQEANALLWGQA